MFSTILTRLLCYYAIEVNMLMFSRYDIDHVLHLSLINAKITKLKWANTAEVFLVIAQSIGQIQIITWPWFINVVVHAELLVIWLIITGSFSVVWQITSSHNHEGVQRKPAIYHCDCVNYIYVYVYICQFNLPFLHPAPRPPPYLVIHMADLNYVHVCLLLCDD